MPFLAEKHIPIPSKDLLSWMFDEQKFDQDKPVRGIDFVSQCSFKTQFTFYQDQFRLIICHT